MNVRGVHSVVDMPLRVSGTIVNVSRAKGCAFIRPDSADGDVCVVLRKFVAKNIRSPRVGMKVSFRLYFQGKNARYRATDLFLLERTPRPKVEIVTASFVCWREAVIKWYDPNRQYGFVSIDGFKDNVYLSKKTMRRWGISCTERIENLPVRVEIGRESRSRRLMVTKIALRGI
jgi:cold shock CspA family protein